MELVDRYLMQKSSTHLIQVTPTIYKSSVYLNQNKYILARKTVCTRNHSTSCTECSSLLNIAQTVIDNGYTVLSEAFGNTFPGIKYTAKVARRRLLQMPLVSIVVGIPSTGRSLSYLLECQDGVNYQAIQQLLASHLKHMEQASVKQL